MPKHTDKQTQRNHMRRVYTVAPIPKAFAKDDDGDGTVEVELFAEGKTLQYDWWEGKFYDEEITGGWIQRIEKSFARESNEIAFNLNHDWFSDGRAYGWLKNVFARKKDDGKYSLYGNVKWNKIAEPLIENEEYKYVSVELSPRDAEEGNDTMDWSHLTGVALTNTPAVRDMQPIAMSAMMRSGQQSQNLQGVPGGFSWVPTTMGTPGTHTTTSSISIADDGVDDDGNPNLATHSQEEDNMPKLTDAQRITALEAENKALKAEAEASQLAAFTSKVTTVFEAQETAGMLSPAESAMLQKEIVTSDNGADILSVVEKVFACKGWTTRKAEGHAGGDPKSETDADYSEVDKHIKAQRSEGKTMRKARESAVEIYGTKTVNGYFDSLEK